MPVSVRNRQPGPTVFIHKETQINWERHGDPDGGDIQQVPDDFFTNVAFLKNIRAGIFEKVDEEVAAEAFDLQTDAYRERLAADAKRSTDLIDDYEERPVATLKVDEKGKTEWVTEERKVKVSQGQAPANLGTVSLSQPDYTEDGNVVEKPESIVFTFGEPLASES